MKKVTSNGAEIDWCLCHPRDGTQPDDLPPGNPMLGICAQCEASGLGALYRAFLGGTSGAEVAG